MRKILLGIPLSGVTVFSAFPLFTQTKIVSMFISAKDKTVLFIDS